LDGGRQQTLMPSASPFRIVNRYFPLHVESSQLQVQLTRRVVPSPFPLSTVTYRYTGSKFNGRRHLLVQELRVEK